MSAFHKFLEGGLGENSFQRPLQHLCVYLDIPLCFIKVLESLIERSHTMEIHFLMQFSL